MRKYKKHKLFFKFNLVGYPEDCTEIYIATPSGLGKWNDVSCHQKLGGVICKKSCEGENNNNSK